MNTIVQKCFSLLPDRLYLDLQYYKNFHKLPNWNNPKSFNEKLQWIKLYDRRPEYISMVDKEAVKGYVKEIIGPEYVIPTLGSWNKPEEIEWDNLPKQFVLKTTHSGGNEGVIICKDKDTFNKELAIQKLTRSLKRNTYLYGREWPYKYVPRRIIAEQFMEDSKTSELRDYKFFCMDGAVHALFIASERQKREEPYFDFYDMNFNHLELKQGHPNSPTPPEKPKTFNQMVELASKLSKQLPEVRVDLYEVNGKVYFGELTFFHFSGIVKFEPEEWDITFGNWISLPTHNGK